MDTDLVFFGHIGNEKNWFKERYFNVGGNVRYWTFATSLSLLNQRIDEPVIIETGCQREKEDLGAGMSSSIFAEYVSYYGGKLYVVDNNEEHLDICDSILEEWPDIDCSLHYSDSVKWLKKYKGKCDLVYLDSYDFPLGPMLDKYKGKEDLGEAITTVLSFSTERVLEEFGDIVLPCQKHCLDEIKAIEPNLSDNAIVLIDDNNLPAEGKPRLAKRYLHEQGWFCLADGQQTLWMRKF